MQYAIIGIGALVGLGVSDGIEATEWYAEEFFEEKEVLVNGAKTIQLKEKLSGYALRWGVGGAIVVAAAAIASATAK